MVLSIAYSAKEEIATQRQIKKIPVRFEPSIRQKMDARARR